MNERINARPISTINLSRKLKLSQMMVFARVLDTGSFIRAANELGLTQPAISKAIFELESFFDEELFNRSNRGVTPTEFGLMLGRRVRSLIAELRFMTDEVHAFRKGDTGHLIVGTLIAASAVLLPRAIAQLQDEAPGVLVTIQEGTAAQLFPKLMTGEIDIVVGRLPERDSQLYTSLPIRHEELYGEEFSVVCGTDHPLAGREDVAVAELADAAWIFPLPESPARMAAEKMFHDAGIPVPIPRVESLSLLANLGLMLHSDLLSFMPRAAAVQLMRVGSLSILSMPAMHNAGRVGFSIRADKDLAPSCKRFLMCLRRAAVDLTQVSE
ncbi:LysR substrate-binding domain-containing protein [Variovorax sp. Sphag1AA]|uniref:LysR substrate-binding domain-containing protein n=1 Tax=Variovorax sp. Sphag1AA TaxID=2587027 RepID=UPI0017A7B02A|nr:LysR substrate-binding domain-containing protein [Variovorax sp. Sphag1AA]MBB3182447.1 DNA-binding transcriptional LysR family regulator [Variovorax sp. Sphag1AA]